MKIRYGKVVIDETDLNRRVSLVKNYGTEETLQAVQFASMESAPHSLCIPIESFEKYNNFRVKNKRKPLTMDEVMLIDVEEFKKLKEIAESKEEEKEEAKVFSGKQKK